MRTVPDTERRARLARRHRLAPGCEARDAEEAAASVVALHGTDPATVHLSVWARVPGFASADLERALYEDRTLVKHMAMRRTIWVVPRRTLPDVQGAASARVATQEHGRLARDVQKAGLHEDGAAWLDGALRDVEGLLSGDEVLTTTEIRKATPALTGATTAGEGKSWGGDVAVGPRVLTVASAQGRIVRAGNDGPWHGSRIRWTRMDDWLGEPLERRAFDQATEGLVAAWLQAFGPGTERDLQWWMGSTLGAVRAALASLEAVEVRLEDGGTGWLLPDDQDPVPTPGAWGALLPSLDPTTMGWKDRGWYLGPHAEHLFDRNGNGGASAWWDGRIVGGWRQRDDGEVELQLLEDIGAEGVADLEARAAALTAWLDGIRPRVRFPAPLAGR